LKVDFQYHPLLLFNGEGECIGAKLRPGNVHSAEEWDRALLPEIERQQGQGKEVVFRGDAVCALRGDTGRRKAGRPLRPAQVRRMMRGVVRIENGNSS
jgi:hypothetical protein